MEQPVLGAKMTFNKRFVKRVLMCLLGVLICSFSVGMFNLAAFGVDPFQCFAQGSHSVFSQYMSYGTYYVIISLIMLVIIFIWDKHYINLGTFINMFLTGYIIDFSYGFLVSVFPDPSVVLRSGMLILGVLILCFGSAFYITADLGVSVYDAIALILAKKKIKIKTYVLPFKWIRVATDCLCVALGMVFGKMPGAGTLVTAFFMGPVISFLNHKAAEPFLNWRTPLLEIVQTEGDA